MTTSNKSNKEVFVNYLSYNRAYELCCNGFESSLWDKYSREEAETVLSGDIRLKEIVVMEPRTEFGRRVWRAEKTILAWLGEGGKFVVANVSHSKEQLKQHLNGCWYFTGHRGGNGPQSSLMASEALSAFCPGWYSKVEEIAGPSSWRIDVAIKDDGTIAAYNMGNEIVLGHI